MDQPWVLNGFFSRPSLNFILGPLGSRKTWLALDLAVSLAAGRGWLSHPAPATPVLYIDEELGLARLQPRIQQALITNAAPRHLPLHFCSRGRYDLAHPHDEAAIRSNALSLAAGLIILDAPLNFDLHLDRRALFSRHRVLAALRRLAEDCNAAVLVILHTPKRRTTLGPALVAFGADHVLAVDSPFGQPLLHLRTTARSALASHLPISLTTRAPYTPWKRPRSRSAPRPISPLGNLGYQALRFLKVEPQATTAALTRTLPSTPKRVRNLISELVNDGYIRRSNPGGRGLPALYELTPAGYALV